MTTKDFLSDLNEEKQKIIKTDGNVLVFIAILLWIISIAIRKFG